MARVSVAIAAIVTIVNQGRSNVRVAVQPAKWIALYWAVKLVLSRAVPLSELPGNQRLFGNL